MLKKLQENKKKVKYFSKNVQLGHSVQVIAQAPIRTLCPFFCPFSPNPRHFGEDAIFFKNIQQNSCFLKIISYICTEL